MPKMFMKIFPEDLNYFVFHLATFGAAACQIMGLEFTVNGKGRLIYEFWPELWIIFPILFWGANIFFVFVERSVLGFVSIAACIAWVIYSKATFPIVLNILGQP